MTSPPSISFSKPAMPGDALSVLVLVEDSDGMATKWPDVRDHYLPNLLDKLRSADPSVQMEARWLTTSALRAPPPVPIIDSAQARAAHDIPLGYTASAKLSPGVISNAINILASASGRQSTTRHLILVAATGPLTHAQSSLGDSTPSGFDSWDEIAIVLKQYYIRLHVILSIGAEMRTYHELFKRSLQLQNNSEVPAWFQVDSRRYSIRLSGRPQYVRGSAALPIPLVPTAIPEDMYNNPSPPASSPPPVSPPTTASTPSSPPPHSASPGARKSSTSPNAPRSRPRASDSPQSPPGSEGGGLVSYLQQMHGLTKKKSYGIKAPKKTYADMRLPNAGRPILPRLEVPQSQSDIYTYPTFDNVHSADVYLPSSDPQLPPPRRHSADQLPATSGVTRTSNDDRRARRRGPWLPITPLVSSTPSSPTSTTSPGTLAALQSLASMTPRLPDFGTMAKDRMNLNMHLNLNLNPSAIAAADPPAAYAVSSIPVSVSTSPSGGYYSTPLTSWGKQAPVPPAPAPAAAASPNSTSSAPSPTHTASSDASRFHTSPPTPSLVSDYTYGSSPPSSTSATPPSLPAPGPAPGPGTGDSGEDQPFVVSPEYEAMVNQRFDEAVRSGAMQASMTGVGVTTAAAAAAGPGPAGVPSGAAYNVSGQDGGTHPHPHPYTRHDPSAYYALQQPVQVLSHADADAAYAAYHAHSAHAYAVESAQGGGGWQYGIDDQYFPPQADYAHAQGPWYS